MANEGGPTLYTVEEAARLLRVGRTKAYAMTQEWRASGGRSGLPVVDFGNVLRVPRAALEQMLGVGLGDAPAPSPPFESELAPAAVPPASDPALDAPHQSTPPPPRPSARRKVPRDQLDLFVAS